MVDRRRFFFGLGAALAAPAIVPFASLMPVRGIVAPSLLKSDEIVRRTLIILDNNLAIARQAFRGYEDEFEAVLVPRWNAGRAALLRMAA